MNAKCAAGLVFAIRLANGKFGFGQVVAKQKPIFYMVAYDILKDIPEIEDHALVSAKPILPGNFFDVLIRNRRWSSVKSAKVPTVPVPCFKILAEGKMYVESWDRMRRRLATDAEVRVLENPTNYSAMYLEHALNAYFGLRQWDAEYKPLRFDSVLAVSELC